ncbi:MAG: hypothetical protein PHG47_06100 [Sulfuricella sp.]|nr:hypothetical protein [Sulfuricella sp.]
MKKFWPFLLLLLPVLLALTLPRFLAGNKVEPILTVQCPDPLSGCQVPFRKGTAEVRFMSAPHPLRPFKLMVTAPDAQQIAADFAMKDMNMGVNRYVLQRTADGSWHGNIVLPVCVSGTSRWVMTLELDGAKRQMDFVATKQ